MTAAPQTARFLSWIKPVAQVLLVLICICALPLVAQRLLAAGDDEWRVGDVTLALAEHADQASDASYSAGQPVTLPDAWDKTHPGFAGIGQYRFVALLTTESAVNRALFVPRLSNGGMVSVNGHLVSTDLSSAGAAAWRWNRPLYLEIPDSLLVDGRNEVIIAVQARANSRAGLSNVYFGPRAVLYPAYRLRWWLQEQLPRLASLAVIAMAIPFILIWLRDPARSADFGLFGVGAIILAIRSLHGQVEAPPIPFDYWRPLVSASLGWALGPFFVFFLRFSGYRLPRTERAIALFIAVGSIGLFLLPSHRFLALAATFWYLPIAALGLFCVGAFTMGTMAAPTRHRVIMLAGVLAQLAPAYHDLLWQQGLISFAEVLWLPLSLPALLMIVSLILADDVARTKAALGSMNRELQAGIAAARRELDAAYERRRASEHAAVSAEERVRLMREMHDGVGTRLALLLSGLHRGGIAIDEVTAAVEASLEELHLLIDARSPNTATLIDAIANFRYRLEPRLAAAGVRTVWDIGDDTEEIALSADATLHVLRIIQECISNAVRHGLAHTVALKLDWATPAPDARPVSAEGVEPPSRFVLLISDDGIGMEAAASSTKGGGRGLQNIKARAAALGGQIEISSSSSGTNVRLSMSAAPDAVFREPSASFSPPALEPGE